MTSNQQRLARLALPIALFAIVVGDDAKAQIAVIDPAEIVQTIEVQYHQLIEEANELREIQNQILQLENEAMMLATLPQDFAGSIVGEASQFTDLLTRTGQIIQQAKSLESAFQQDFPPTLGKATFDAINQNYTQANTNLRTAISSSYDTQRTLAASLQYHAATTNSIMGASRSASGTTSAVQAQTSMLGQVSTQIGELNSGIVAMLRTQSDSNVRSLALESQQDNAHALAWQDVGTLDAPTASLPWEHR